MSGTIPMATIGQFDVQGPLPDGETMVLEASAGTGKTYTIASLAARYLAEGVARLEDLMLVTFGRMATQELRDRVRGRLVEVERALADPAREQSDPVITQLLAGTADQIRQRRDRLATALASFDEATIATTHSFCLRMLAGLGIAADAEPGAQLLEDPLEKLRQITDDVYLRRYADRPLEERPFGPTTALDLASDVMGAAQARIVPADPEPGSAAAERVEFAAEVRAEFDLRKRQEGLYDFDDLQNRLAEALSDPTRGEAAQQLLRAAYRVVLVDEFQDTDPVQWNILELAFHGHRTLILIGDPKQAIYAFRGADVFTYLQAAKAADRRETLGTNWRSDAPLVRGLGHLWGGLTLGDPEIPIREVHAHHSDARLDVPGGTAPIRIRQLLRPHAEQTARGFSVTPSAVRAIAADTAAEVVRLLDSGATVTHQGTTRPIEPSDIAVLVKTNDQGEKVRQALRDRNVPVVLTGNSSVFSSESARHWHILLEALEAPNRSSRVRAVALTPFIGWTATELAEAGSGEIDRLIDRLRGWAGRFRTGGMAALLETVTVEADIGARVLATADGDRRLTDIRHIAHALHTVSRAEHLGPSALLEWLRRRIDEPAGDAADELSRRLSSEDAAVQVYTVHKSKGLEFGVVMVPYAWNRWVPDEDRMTTLRLHDEAGLPVLDVGGPAGDGFAERLERHREEEFGEDLRELYVAFTRARSQLVTWWAPGWNARCSPLSRVLFAEADEAGRLPVEVEFGTDAEIADALEAVAAKTGGLVAVETTEPGRSDKYSPTVVPAERLGIRVFDRELDGDWRRTSYSSLTAAAHAAHYEGLGHPEEPIGGAVVVDSGSEPETPGTIDEPAVPVVPSASAAVSVGGTQVEQAEGLLRAIPSPLEDFPGGKAFGTVVHEVLEYLDTSAADLPAELLAHCERVLGSSAGRDVDGQFDAERLAAALGPVFATPLGPAAEGLTLAQVRPADRLAEMSFELPLAGGDNPHAESRIGDLADVLDRHLGADDLLAGYPDMVRDKLLAGEPLRGYLTGSLDAVIRVHGPDGIPRFLVADYKTNRLGVPGEPLSAWDYRPTAMAEGMMAAHYPLQALLYDVALHRYLRWRLPGYDPAVHLGGALYLFVRGMSGPDTPMVDGMPCGVFVWQPPAALVLESSEVLAG